LNKTFFSITIFGLLLVSSLFVFSVSSQQVEAASSGTTLYVGGTAPGNYSKIQYAINNASKNDTIYVYNGIYYENIVINVENLSLIGESRENTTIDGSENGDVVYISAINVTIKNFTIQNSGNDLTMWDAGIDVQAKHANICKSIIKNNYIGIGLINPGDATEINSNEISNNEYSGLIISTYNNHMERNIIEGNYVGVIISARNGNQIERNQIIYNDVGLKFDECLASINKFEILSNEVSYNEIGLESSIPIFSDYCQIHIHKNNFIKNNRNKFMYINDKFENNYWDDWIGFGPYWIRGLPFVKIFPNFRFILHFNFDHSPGSEPYDIDF